jgi:hypothetical protein
MLHFIATHQLVADENIGRELTHAPNFEKRTELSRLALASALYVVPQLREDQELSPQAAVCLAA